MGLIEQIRLDVKSITASLSDFGVEMLLTAPGGATCYITGYHSKHHLGVNEEGKAVNTKNAHISFSESNLTNFSIRNDAGEVSLRDYKVRVKDSTGLDKNYKIDEWFPDETVGLIVCTLSFFE